jgi:hypothetical protein
MNEPGYEGISLSSNDEWVYCSPMSWHPDGARVMWMEMVRGSEAGGARPRMRARVARLRDHTAAQAVPPVPTPNEVPYGIAGADAEEVLRRQSAPVTSGRIAGIHSGYIAFERQQEDLTLGRAAAARTEYENFSDDGRSVYNGYERTVSALVSGTVYEADLELVGDTSGEMRLRATWTGLQDKARLLFDRDVDGKPKTHGYARYGDVVMQIGELFD